MLKGFVCDLLVPTLGCLSVSGKGFVPLLHFIPCVSKFADQCLLPEPCAILLLCTEVPVPGPCRSQ